MVAAAAMFSGCSGDDGSNGSNGLEGPQGQAGVNATDPATVVKASELTPAEWSDLSFDAKSDIIGVPTINNLTVVNFKVTSGGKPVVGLPTTNMSFAIAKLVPATDKAPSRWVNYNVISADQTKGTYPSVESAKGKNLGTLLDNNDGTYQYTFNLDITKAKEMVAAMADPNKEALGDLTYDPTLTHRLVVAISSLSANSSDWAFALKVPYERIIDFIPATGEIVTDKSGRDVISGESCKDCHSGIKQYTAHHGTRQDPRYCMVCHNDQIKYGSTDEVAVDGAYDFASTNMINDFALGDFTNFVHKIHMGTKLAMTGYNFENMAEGGVPAMAFDAVKYPQNILNCTQCHKDAANADNWNQAPSRLACGSCHDDINFTNGIGHSVSNIPLADDAACAMCHKADDVKTYHTLPANADDSLRTMSMSIDKVEIDADLAGTGKVTAFFTVRNNDLPVTTLDGFLDTTSGGGPYPQFTLTKLVKGEDGATKWVSYTSRFRTKNATLLPLLQGGADTDKSGARYAIVDAAKGQYRYTFELNNAEKDGDIRTMDIAHAHVDPRSLDVGYNSADKPAPMILVLPAEFQENFTETFEDTATHRVTMALSGAKMKKAAIYDFVPNGDVVTETRNIVSMDSCNNCHAGNVMHRGYSVELCASCHTADTSDSATGRSAEMQTFIHKLHMGRNLSEVQNDGEYIINGHDYTKLGYPGDINNCQVCHVEENKTMGDAANWRTNPTAGACITCHDSASSVAHAALNVNACATCHASGRVYGVDIMHQ